MLTALTALMVVTSTTASPIVIKNGNIKPEEFSPPQPTKVPLINHGTNIESIIKGQYLTPNYDQEASSHQIGKTGQLRKQGRHHNLVHFNKRSFIFSMPPIVKIVETKDVVNSGARKVMFAHSKVLISIIAFNTIIAKYCQFV